MGCRLIASMRTAARQAMTVLALLMAIAPGIAGAIDQPGETVTIALPDGTLLRAHWFPLAGAGARPAVIALHGCGGLYRRDGKTLSERYPEYVERFHRAGYHVLLPDSFGSRGSGAICATPATDRKIKVDTRRGDVAAAVNWIAARPEVDARRIALLGWSNGASTTLAAVNRARAGSAAPLAAAVVLYPGCRDFLRQPFSLGEPMLMLLGADDDWTPPASCLALADRIRARQPGVDLTVRVYEGSVHGFDSAGPVRFWKDIPNGKDPTGVHVGGNPQARTAALAEIDAFLKRTLGP